MIKHLFGGFWSPSCAAYAMQRTFRDNGTSHPSELSEVIRSFFVDELLLSTDSTEDTITLSKEVASLLSMRGFRLTKWTSNKRGSLRCHSIRIEEQSNEENRLKLGWPTH